MSCKRCDELIVAYEHSVRLYTDTAKSLRGMLGDDFRRTLLVVEGLRLACKRADDDLVSHWQTEHPAWKAHPRF